MVDDNVDWIEWSIDFNYFLYLVLAIQVALLLLDAVAQVV